MPPKHFEGKFGIPPSHPTESLLTQALYRLPASISPEQIEDLSGEIVRKVNEERNHIDEIALSEEEVTNLKIKLARHLERNSEVIPIEIPTVVDALMESPRFLQSDKGSIGKLLKMHEMKTLQNVAELRRQKALQTGNEGLNPYENLFETSGGYYLARLLNMPHLRDESTYMKHCVGNSRSYINKMIRGDIEILSLREKATDQPLVTIEYDCKNHQLLQIKTKKDRIPTLADDFASDLLEAIERLPETRNDQNEPRIVKDFETQHLRHLIDLKEKQSRGDAFTKADLIFLHETSEQVKGFDGRNEPFFEELQRTRNWKADMCQIYDADINDDNGLAQKIITEKGSEFIVKNIEKFRDLGTAMAHELIAIGESKAVAENLNRFNVINYDEIALLLITKGELGILADNLRNFHYLSLDIARQLIKEGYQEQIVFGGGSAAFSGLYRNTLVKMLLDERKKYLILDYDRLFYKGLDSEIAKKLIRLGEIDFVANDLNRFEKLDIEVAQLLYKSGYSRNVAEMLGRFEALDYMELVRQLIKDGEGKFVTEMIRKIEGFAQHLEHNEVVQQLGTKYSMRSLVGFKGLNAKTAHVLINNGDIATVIGNIYRFEKLDTKIAINIFNSSVIPNYRLDESAKSQKARIVAENLERFEGLDESVAESLIRERHSQQVAKHIDSFTELNGRVAQQLIADGFQWVVVGNLEKFRGLDHKELVQQLLMNGTSDVVVKNIDKFEDLDAESAQQLINAGEIQAVAENVERFQGLNEEFKNNILAQAEKK
jgi:hypothetical protein